MSENVFKLLKRKSSKLSAGHVACSFEILAEIKFDRRPQNYWWASDKYYSFFKKIYFSSKFYHWHVECSFDNSTEYFSTKGFKVTAQSPKRIGNFFSNFSSNCFYGHVECAFDNPVRTLLRKDRIFFAHCPKMMESFFFSDNFLKTVLTTRRTQLWQLTWKKKWTKGLKFVGE